MLIGYMRVSSGDERRLPCSATPCSRPGSISVTCIRIALRARDDSAGAEGLPCGIVRVTCWSFGSSTVWADHSPT